MAGLASLFIGKPEKSKESNHHGTQDAPKTYKKNYKILFVDDEENVLKAMLRIFRRENYTLLTAASGSDALKIIEDEPVHVVISDYQMPGMSGADLLRKIKAMHPQTIRIMLTGHADVNAIMGAVNEGAVYKFITKPWNDDDLRLTVSLALEQYDLIEENKSLKKQKDVQQKKIKQLSRYVNSSRSEIGRFLLRRKIIRKDDLKKAESIQARTNKILPEILIDMGIVDEQTIIKTIQLEMNIKRVYPKEFTVPKELALFIPREICEKNLLVPLKRSEGILTVAMADPTDYVKVDELKFIASLPIQPVLSAQKEIIEKLRELYDDNDLLKHEFAELDLIDPSENLEIIIDDDEETDIDELLNIKDEPSAIRIVNAIISDALRHNASDIHIEPKVKYIMVRYRIDGLLVDKIHIPLSMHLAIISRIKIMSEMDISERRKPQDGRVTVKTSSRMVDMRISTLPTIGGEKVVLRILDKNAAIMDIEKLGFSDRDFEIVSRFIDLPQGIVLVTGPTGSGKTSTLYSLLLQGATITKNFTTIEDPVEYFMSMAEQVHVRKKIGLDFPVILRSLLRQDPNVIMLGEIRDFETAEVAFHAALTGHLVLSTLHTNSSISSIIRLKDIGVKPYVIAEALAGIVAQRLVRKICPQCIVEDNPPEKVLRALKLDKNKSSFTSRKGAGCEYCNHTGYKGRIAIFEVLQIDEELKRIINEDVAEKTIMAAARMAGMTTLLDDAVNKVKTGITTCEEILRVIGPQNRLEIPCPKCGTGLEERFQFCPFCGAAINPLCAGCGKFLELGWKNCPHCGRGVKGKTYDKHQHNRDDKR